MSTDFDAARAALRRESPADFSPWRLRRPSAAVIREADNDLHNGWVRDADREVIQLSAPYPWEGGGTTAAAVDESHAWAAVDALLVAHSATGSWPYLETAIELAEDWADHGAQTGRAWSAFATPGRSHRLAYIVHAAAIAEAIDMRRWRSLARLAERHAERLDPTTIGVAGVTAAVALHSLQSRLGDHLSLASPATIKEALARATDDRGALVSAVTAEHVLAVTALAAAASIDIEPERVAVEDGLAWLITTDGHPANFGPTALEPVNGLWRGGSVNVQELVEPLVSEHLQHALSRGASGSPPTSDTRTLDGAGVLVAKPVWPTSESALGSYLAACRSSGDFVWHDDGRPIIVSPGTDIEALDGGRGDRLDQARTWFEAGSASNALAARPHIDRSSTSARLGTLNGTTFLDLSSSSDTVATRRSLVVNPGRWLFIADWLTDTNDSLRKIEQSLLLGPGLDAMDENDGYLVTNQGEPVAWVSTIHGDAQPAGPRRGGAGGGWWAPRPGRIAPATQISFRTEAAHTLIATVISLIGPIQPQRDDAWSYSFVAGGRQSRISFHEKGLTDMQEVAV